MVDFKQCAASYLGNTTLQEIYGYTGQTINIPQNRSTQITYHGCEALCGATQDYYKWDQIATTITTWVLPVIGVLLQAPWESNALWGTCFAMIRWLGSPIASLSYILWNIRTTGECAKIVDLADTINPPLNEEHFSSIRDSFYLLATMNQFSLKTAALSNREAEGLLRIVLFSKDLTSLDGRFNLEKNRTRVARILREHRRRGVVPAMISNMWFIVALAISIQSAFGFVGENATAHDLALGLVFAWLPVQILACIVDRNFNVQKDAMRLLNSLIDPVCELLQDHDARNAYVATFHYYDQKEQEKMKQWVEDISRKCESFKKIFVEFAGQGRRRFHYGAAHPILSSIETNFLQKMKLGRGWLHDEATARYNLVLGEPEGYFLWFDFRQVWQVLGSVVIVLGTILGAFVLSFYTPTVGLGCRSGGYMIFAVLCLFLMTVEMVVWWLTTPVELSHTVTHRRRSSVSRRVHGLRAHIQSKVNREHFQRYTDAVLKVGELANTTWLLYIGLSQTVGHYNTCACQSSLWAGGGGYVDFIQYAQADKRAVHPYWVTGTVLSTAVMGLAMIYIVVEWCLQSHLSTENFQHATNGLQRCRTFRWLLSPFSITSRFVTRGCGTLKRNLLNSCGVRERHEHRSLSWRYMDDLPPVRAPTFDSAAVNPDYGYGNVQTTTYATGPQETAYPGPSKSGFYQNVRTHSYG